jgi:glycosyltransferase involved in cell wall biosynthesis
MASLSVAQFGPYPPSMMGGVSTHIRRLHNRLLDLGADSQVFARMTGKSSDPAVIPQHGFHRPLCYFSSALTPGARVRAKIVHCHDYWGHLAPSLTRLMLSGKRVVVTVHDQRDEEKWQTLGPLQFLSSLLLVRQPNVKWIAVSDAIRCQLIDRGVAPNQIVVIPAFLPPQAASENSARLPPEVEKFVETHSPILSIYGFRLWLDKGIDVYGFDMCIKLVKQLKANYPGIGLVISLPCIHLPEYYSALVERVARLGLSENILFHTKPMEEAYPLWKLSDVYLRPTSTDGDAVAVRESLGFSTPVVASDVVPRPVGVHVFQHRDQSAFFGAVSGVLQNRDASRTALMRLPSADRFEDIARVYQGASE